MVVSKSFYGYPYLGKISNSTSIFFKWVGSTTNYRQVLNPDFLYLDIEINSEVNLQSCVQSTVEVPSKEILEIIFLDGIE